MLSRDYNIMQYTYEFGLLKNMVLNMERSGMYHSLILRVSYSTRFWPPTIPYDLNYTLRLDDSTGMIRITTQCLMMITFIMIDSSRQQPEFHELDELFNKFIKD